MKTNIYKKSDEETLDLFANVIVDRILEEKKLYIETLNKSGKSNKEFNSKDFLKFVKKRISMFNKSNTK